MDRANSLQIQGLHRQAENIFLSLIQNAKLLDLQGADLASVLNAVGGLYTQLGQYADAELHLKRSLALLGEPSLNRSSDWLLTANNLVSLYTETGELDRAIPLAERVVRVFDSIPDEHPLDRARALHNLASIYYVKGRYQQAESLLRIALESQKLQGMEEENVDLMYVLISMGSVLLRTGQSGEALACAVSARRIGERVFGPDHIVLSRVLILEAAVYRSTGRNAEAAIAARKALAVLPADARPLLHVAWDEYARVLRQAGRRAEAKAAETRARNIQEDLQKGNPARHRVGLAALADH